MSADKREDVIKKAEGWLTELGFEYAREQVETGGGEREPMLFIRFKGKEKLPDYDVQINARGEWVICKARLAVAKQIAKSKRAGVYGALLKANYRYSEVNFNLNDEGDVFVECDVHKDARTRTFEVEFNSLPIGMSIFTEEIAPEFAIKLS